jgi:hypothetical protein
MPWNVYNEGFPIMKYLITLKLSYNEHLRSGVRYNQADLSSKTNIFT